MKAKLSDFVREQKSVPRRQTSASRVAQEKRLLEFDKWFQDANSASASCTAGAGAAAAGAAAAAANGVDAAAGTTGAISDAHARSVLYQRFTDPEVAFHYTYLTSQIHQPRSSFSLHPRWS